MPRLPARARLVQITCILLAALAISGLLLKLYSGSQVAPRVRPKFIPASGGKPRNSTLHESASELPSFHEEETLLAGNVLKYERTLEGAHPDLLWLVMTYDKASWGNLHYIIPRSIKDLHEIIAAQYNVRDMSLGLLTSSYDEYLAYRESVRELGYARVTVFLHEGFHAGGEVVDRAHRHDPKLQVQRRGELAKLRNYLMLRALRDERHVVWSDADVWFLDAGIVPRMLEHAAATPEVGLLTARCNKHLFYDYDYNAWSGTRERQTHVKELIKGTTKDDLVHLDTIGGTLLYIRSSLIWQGLSFPHQNTIGTSWGQDGNDGIESEGLCYRARGMEGGECRVLGGSWHVTHV